MLKRRAAPAAASEEEGLEEMEREVPPEAMARVAGSSELPVAAAEQRRSLLARYLSAEKGHAAKASQRLLRQLEWRAEFMPTGRVHEVGVWLGRAGCVRAEVQCGATSAPPTTPPLLAPPPPPPCRPAWPLTLLCARCCCSRPTRRGGRCWWWWRATTCRGRSPRPSALSPTASRCGRACSSTHPERMRAPSTLPPTASRHHPAPHATGDLSPHLGHAQHRRPRRRHL